MLCNRASLRAPALLSVALIVTQGASAAAHNSHVHQSMTDFAYQIMRLVAQASPPERLVSTPAQDAADWPAFLAAIQAAVPKLQGLPAALPEQKSSRCFPPPSTEPPPDWAVDSTLGALPYAVNADYLTGSSFDCGVNSGYAAGPMVADFGDDSTDYTGTGLGFWAQNVDDEVDDFHGEIKPLNAAGLGYLKDKLSDLTELGLLVALVPFICLGDCLLSFGDCDSCLDQAKQAASNGNPIKNIEALLPGFGDISGSTYTGLWHFIDMRPGASNAYDDRQGMLYEEAGPLGVPGAVDMAIMVLADATGLTVNGSDSLGVSRYQITGAGDSHPDTSPVRSASDFEITTIGHVEFEPLDNLGFYGWRGFRKDSTHRAKWLAWPLHALGDATVPMHVAGTTSWGHRPYEDATERLLPTLIAANQQGLAQLMVARQVLLIGYSWFKVIQAWRAAHNSTDVPIRELVTELAHNTYTYSVNQGVPGTTWPFLDPMSVTYLVDGDSATSVYESDSHAVDGGQHLLFDGMGAIVAFLATGMEVVP